MGVKRFGSESELNAQLRKLTEEVRHLREELRGSVHEKRRNIKRALDASAARRPGPFPPDDGPAC